MGMKSSPLTPEQPVLDCCIRPDDTEPGIQTPVRQVRQNSTCSSALDISLYICLIPGVLADIIIIKVRILFHLDSRILNFNEMRVCTNTEDKVSEDVNYDSP